MSRIMLIALGAVIGFVIQASRSVSAMPSGASLDVAGILGAATAGALIGALGGAIVAMLTRRK